MFPSSRTVKQLFYANIAIFVLGIILELVSFPFFEIFALFPKDGFMVHQLITHQFLHGGLLHLLFNMLALISIGAVVENYLGRTKFIIFYLLSGLGAAFLHMFLVDSSVPMVGASGAIYGLLLMFAILNPNEKLYFFGLLGLKSKYLISTLFLIEVVLGITSNGNGGVAHFAHVGGGLTGIILILLNIYHNKRKYGSRPY